MTEKKSWEIFLGSLNFAPHKISLYLFLSFFFFIFLLSVFFPFFFFSAACQWCDCVVVAGELFFSHFAGDKFYSPTSVANCLIMFCLYIRKRSEFVSKMLEILLKCGIFFARSESDLQFIARVRFVSDCQKFRIKSAFVPLGMSLCSFYYLSLVTISVLPRVIFYCISCLKIQLLIYRRILFEKSLLKKSAAGGGWG